MASISKRKYWADPNTGKEVRCGTPGAVRRESRYYRIRYEDSSGKLQSVKGYIDLRATRQLAARLEAAAARGEEGLVNRFSVHDKTPIDKHFADYVKDLEMRGRDDENLQILFYRFKRLKEDCGWTRLRDVTPESFDDWRRKRFGQPGSSGKTLNHFFDTMRAFLNWCASPSRNRILRNPLTGLERLPHKPTFHRRALQPEELTSLYKAAPEERYRVYVFAVTTGLRRTEIADLQWGDVVLDAPQPFLQLRDFATKARRADVFAIKEEVAAMLRQMRPQMWAEEDKVFASVPEVSELVADLEAAGVEMPDAEDENDLDRIDFHALRTTLGSFIGRAGIAERVGMELLRVTDPKLLRRTYCDPRILQTAQAAAKLDIPVARPGDPAAPASEPVIRTGTDPFPLSAAASDDGNAADSGRNRTKDVVGQGRSQAVIGGIVVTTDGGQTLSLKGFAWQNMARGGNRRPRQKMDRVGFEPTKQTRELTGNFKFPAASGPLSDYSNTLSETSPASTPPDEFLDGLAAIWPALPVGVRQSILELAKAAAPKHL